MSKLRLTLLYLIVVGVWGTTWLAIKCPLASIPPITASGLRFAIAFPLLALIITRMPKARLRYPPGHPAPVRARHARLLRRALRADEPRQRGHSLRPRRGSLRHRLAVHPRPLGPHARPPDHAPAGGRGRRRAGGDPRADRAPDRRRRRGQAA